jgi:hypothetical protein
MSGAEGVAGDVKWDRVAGRERTALCGIIRAFDRYLATSSRNFPPILVYRASLCYRNRKFMIGRSGSRLWLRQGSAKENARTDPSGRAERRESATLPTALILDRKGDDEGANGSNANHSPEP